MNLDAALKLMLDNKKELKAQYGIPTAELGELMYIMSGVIKELHKGGEPLTQLLLAKVGIQTLSKLVGIICILAELDEHKVITVSDSIKDTAKQAGDEILLDLGGVGEANAAIQKAVGL